MGSNTRLLTAPGGLAALALFAWSALAAARADEGDPPGRVARLSDVEGAVSLQPAGLADWTAAPLNRPITSGDRLWSDQQSRAELDMGAAAARLGSTTGFSFLNLDDVVAQMQLSAGTLIVHVRAVEGDQIYEIDTPNVAVSLQQPGEYRVEVSGAGDATTVKVSAGAAQATGGAQTIAIGMQQRVTFTGTNTLAYSSATLGPPDDLDNWSAAREQQAENSSSAEYVADDVPGTQDLDNNGRWEDTPDYGYAWVPTAVVVGWVPYRYGRWVWIAPWGWTWVDAAPWGYAPFHYGRWVEWHNTWCWVPGPRPLRPVYAPALVAWVGGPSVATSPAFGNGVAWFPLAPREPYVPAYRVSAAYLRNVNITNTTIANDSLLTNISQGHFSPTHYLNNRPAAVTLVPEPIFLSGQRVGTRAVPLPAPVLAGGIVTATAPALAPTRQSVLGPGDGHSVAQPPAALLQRTVVVRTAPPRAPAPFDRQLAAIEANDGRPLTHAESARLQPATPAAPVRRIAAAGPVIAAAALPQRVPASSGSLAGPPAQAADPAMNNLADRERLLESTAHLPPALHANAAAPPEQRLNTYPPPTSVAADPAPPSRSDRPPWVQESQSSVQQQSFAADDPTHMRGRPTSLPVYHPPGGADPGTPDASVQSDSTYRSAHTRTPRPAAPAQPATHQQAPAQKQSSKEPRESAAHGDRESRDRVSR
jgi:hypothetical protein